MPTPGPGKSVARCEIRIDADGHSPPSVVRAVVSALARAEGVIYRVASVTTDRSEGGWVQRLGPHAAEPPDVVVPDVSEWPTGREVVDAAVARSVAHLLLHLPRRVSVPIPKASIRPASRFSTAPFRSADVRSACRSNGGQRAATTRPLGGPARLGSQRRRAHHEAAGARSRGRVGRRFPAGAAPRHAATVRALDQSRTTALLDGLVLFSRIRKGRRKRTTQLTSCSRPRVRSRWRFLKAAVAALGDEPDDEPLHELRILAKRCRYVLEATAPVFGQPSADLAKSIEGSRTCWAISMTPR